MLNKIREYVNFETPTGDSKRLNAFIDILSRDFIETGAEIERIKLPSGDLLRASIGSGTQKVILLGHADTVFEFGKAEKFDIENGRLYGAGVADMKTGLVMMLEIFRYFKHHISNEWCLEALINSDEERGSSESKLYVVNSARNAKLCLCFEASPEGRCTQKRKGVVSYELSLRGHSAHSSGEGAQKRSATRALVEIFSQIYTLESENADLCVNIGSIHADGRANIVSGRATTLFEIRSYSHDVLNYANKRVFEICKGIRENVNVELLIMGERPPMCESVESQTIFEIARKFAKREGLQLESVSRGGGSDGSFAALAGAPVLDGIGAEGGNAHSRREYVIANTVEARTRMNIAILKAVMN